jgi:hypothetical protein
MLKKAIFIFVGVCVALFVLIQLIPYGHDHTNPSVTSQIKWDSPQTEKLVRSTCYDCHSNETTWPWYSNIAPASWLLQRDVEEARMNVNFSVQDNSNIEARELIRQIQSGKMPPPQYLIIHTNANLSAEQKQQLIDGINKTFTGN